MPSANADVLWLDGGDASGARLGVYIEFVALIPYENLAERAMLDGDYAAMMAADPDPPELFNFVPPLNAKIARNQPIQFDMHDIQGSIAAAILRCSIRGEKVTEVIYEYDSFVAPYLDSTMTVLPNGDWRFVLRRAGGWTGAPQFRAFVLDRAGNINA